LERQVRDSCGKSGSGETPQEQSNEEAPRTPAESERLERKSTDKFNGTFMFKKGLHAKPLNIISQKSTKIELFFHGNTFSAKKYCLILNIFL
jgi:hypothetical protein